MILETLPSMDLPKDYTRGSSTSCVSRKLRYTNWKLTIEPFAYAGPKACLELLTAVKPMHGLSAIPADI
jgi:hypothetical protein